MNAGSASAMLSVGISSTLKEGEEAGAAPKSAGGMAAAALTARLASIACRYARRALFNRPFDKARVRLLRINAANTLAASGAGESAVVPIWYTFVEWAEYVGVQHVVVFCRKCSLVN